MPVFSKGSVQVNLGFIQISGELSEEDRQAAWRLYTELTTRVAVRGKTIDGREDFGGEVYTESLASVFRFFQAAREIMSTYPVGKIGSSTDQHLGFFVSQMLELVVRPFLEKWQAHYRRWWANVADPKLFPFQRQQQYPYVAELEADWTDVRRFCRDAARELARTYHLFDVIEAMPSALREAWGAPKG